MYEWRNNPEYVRNEGHTERWDRALLTFGETVSDTSLTPLTSAEAQGFADRGSAWGRWISVADALRDIESSRQQWLLQQHQRQQWLLQQATSTVDTVPGNSDSPNRAPTVSAALSDVTGLEAGATQDVSLSGVFDDPDNDALTVTATSSNDAVVTVTVASDGCSLTVEGVSQGTATITVTAQDPDGSRASDFFDVSVAPESSGKYAALIAKMYDWRNDRQWAGDPNWDSKPHTDRWDRALLAFGETVADTSLTAMPASEAQGYADRGWTRWVEVAAALKEIEAAGQQRPTPNRAPTVSSAISDATIVNESGTHQVSLTGVFNDGDGDSLTIAAASSDTARATVSVASDYSTLTVNAQSRGTATFTVTADDGNGGTVDDTFTVTVKVAPVVASALGDVSALVADATRDVSLAGVFSDADNDALTITAASSDETKATVTVASDGSKLTLTGVAEGTTSITVTAQDSDGNRVSDAFDVSVSAPPPQEPKQPNGPPPSVLNLRCIAETDRVAFLWDAPEWSGGETYAYDYQLTLPGGGSEGGRLAGSTSTLLYRPGDYAAGAETSVSVRAVYETSDGREVSSAEATLTCTVQ